MNRIELKENLDLLEIDKNQYSLDGSLDPDSIVLFYNYDKWEVFYLDERGGRNNEKVFKSENDACLYIYLLFKDAKGIKDEFGINT